MNDDVPGAGSVSAPYLLRTARLGLRRWRPTDLDPFARMNGDPAVMEYFPRVSTAAESAALVDRIEAHFGEFGFGLYATDRLDTGEFIGFVGLSRPSFSAWFTPCFEIGWRLRVSAWGQGFATEAALEVLRYGLMEVGLERIYSWTAAVNLRSERVMQKIGMVKVGEFEHPKVEEGSGLKTQLS
ncbi:MAG TPA: GNAT family N-acetyltransferase [Puia sp.]|nr:GNAT family N-acetyltransferase [Puia sp.]